MFIYRNIIRGSLASSDKTADPTVRSPNVQKET